MTVTNDGLLVCTDPGVGIPAPGWHGEEAGVGGDGGDVLSVEQYVNTIAAEGKTVIRMAKTSILPAAVRHQSELAGACANLKAIGAEFDTGALDEITGLVTDLRAHIAALEEVTAVDDFESPLAEARHSCDGVLPAMLAVRAVADALEGLVADDLWPLATYQEMLFIK